jgi:hypothetical protein
MGWFRKSIKMGWLGKQQERKEMKTKNFEFSEMKQSTIKWLKSGLFFGLFMYLIMIIVFPWIDGEEITQRKLLIGIPFWLIGGLGWGYIMKVWMKRKG